MSVSVKLILTLVIGYLLGSISTGVIVSRVFGHQDIRSEGSGNSGTTNMLRVMGKKYALLTFAGDLLKGIVAVLIGKAWLGTQAGEIVGAFGAILGHNFPFYLQFKGGKGIAATAGLILAFHWPFLIVAIPVFCILFFTTHYVSVGSLAVYIGFITELIVLGQKGYFGMSQPALLEMYAVGIFLMIMAFVRHKENIKRLFAGTERKTYLFKANKED